MKIINASICIDSIQENKINVGKNGKKYLNLSIIINDTQNEYGNDVSISQSQTKEEREAKEKPNYLGNGKVVFTKEPL